jgi:ABC-type nickel/cobalt efflux system permease component RcnA
MSQTRGPNDNDSHSVTRALLSALRRALPDIANDASTALLVGIALWLATLVGPMLGNKLAEAQALHARRTAEINQTLCDKWGLVPGSRAFVQCRHDLQHIHDHQAACEQQHSIFFD